MCDCVFHYIRFTGDVVNFPRYELLLAFRSKVVSRVMMIDQSLFWFECSTDLVGSRDFFLLKTYFSLVERIRERKLSCAGAPEK